MNLIKSLVFYYVSYLIYPICSDYYPEVMPINQDLLSRGSYN